MMKISVKEIREKLIPLLCSIRIGCRKCNDSRCSKAIDTAQNWLDTLYSMDMAEKEKLHCMGSDDWTVR